MVLLGGPEEHDKNARLALATGATYPGHFDLRTFIGLVDRCDLVVSAVTMAMHIALGLGKRLVLLNNIFNPREFELYGRGVIVQPPQACSCFFQPRCTAPSFCLESLEPATVQVATLDLLGIREESISIAGGIVLFLISLRMLFPGAPRDAHELSGEPLVVPLAIPMVAS